MKRRILRQRTAKRTRARNLLCERLELRQLMAGDIVGTLYHDVNENGVRDQGEDGLSAWTVYLDSNNNGSFDADELSDRTNADGEYRFSGLAAGTYRVSEVLRDAWTPTNPDTGWQDVEVLDGKESRANFLVAGSTGTGAIAGNVWKDLGNDGNKDPEDVGIAGWTVFIDLNRNKILDSAEPFEITDGDGNYLFTGLLGGTNGDSISYEVQQQLTDGWEPAAGFDENYTAEVVEGETFVGPDFANTPISRSMIAGRLWNDVNGDGIQSSGESGLSGWQVFVDANRNGELDLGERSATTSVSGSYELMSLDPGLVEVTAVIPISFQPTNPASGKRTVLAPSDGTLANVDFGFRERTEAGIRGTIYTDRNHNGIREANEEGLAGITVYLDANDNGVLDADEVSVVTSGDLYYTPDIDEAGTYAFEALAAGTYVIRQVLPDELSATPTSEAAKSVTVGPTDLLLDVDAADRYRPSEIHGVKFEDVNGNALRDEGEPGIAGVTIYVDLNRNNVLDAGEPSTVTLEDGSYEFKDLETGAYVVREVIPAGWRQTFPETRDGILWPEGASHAPLGDVDPSLIEISLAESETHSQSVSLKLPSTGALTNMVDVFMLFDDTGSFRNNSPIVRDAFPNIMSQLQTRLPGIDLGFGVGRLEEYANFAQEYATGRPFILNQPIISASTGGYTNAEMQASIQSALNRETPGYGGDGPETVVEALYQLVTGAGFDGNNNGSKLDSGPAGLAATQQSPGSSGDVPAFSTFTADPSNGVLSPSGTIGGAGFRPGALPIIITATDIGFAYQAKGESDIVGIDGLAIPASTLGYHGRSTTPFASGAGLQETVTGLNALGALVIGLGTSDAASQDPRIGLEALASLTGSINRSDVTIANGTLDPIAPGDPFYFKIGSGGDPLVGNIADGIITAIEGAVTSVNVNVTLRASDPSVNLQFSPDVLRGLGAGDTAGFDVTFTGDGRPHRFDLQFVREGTDVVLGSIPVVIGTPIAGDGYEFEDCDDGEFSLEVDFGNQQIDGFIPNQAPSFVPGLDQFILEDSGTLVVPNWATDISPGPVNEQSQIVDFITSVDHPELFSALPALAADGTLTLTPADNQFGVAVVSVVAHDDGGTEGGGIDTSATHFLTITIDSVNDQPVAENDAYTLSENEVLTVDAPGLLANDSDIDSTNLTASLFEMPAHGSVVLQPDGSFRYEPELGYYGTDSFTYVASDGELDSLPATVTLTIEYVPAPEEFDLLVVDQSRRRTYQYSTSGDSLASNRLDKEDQGPRGLTVSPDGQVRWVVDKKGEIFVYDFENQLIGEWELKGVDKPEGIALNGSDLWVVDRGEDRLVLYADAASLRSGQARPTASWPLARENRNAMGLATDGTKFWVVDDGSTQDRVFVYSMNIELAGSWTIDASNDSPSGITIAATELGQVWIVDQHRDAVFSYSDAANRVEGVQAADFTFDLDPSNRNAQGIAVVPRGESASATALAGLMSPPSEFDANDDGVESPLDALVIINYVNRHGREKLDTDSVPSLALFDVNDNGWIEPLDALKVINRQNRDKPEGELHGLAMQELVSEDLLELDWLNDRRAR